MTGDYDSFEDHRIKHLEMIQAVIGRLGNDSFLVKGWAVTVAGVFFGFAVNKSDAGLAVVSLLPTLLFWGLDTYFLRAERLFRVLYDHVRRPSSSVEPFLMAATSPTFVKALPLGRERDAASAWKTFKSTTLLIFYAGLVLSALVVAVAIWKS